MSLSDTFFALASERFASYPSVRHTWSGPERSGKRVLELPSEAESGFTVRVDCEPYGLYVYAGDWHGAPFECGPDAATLETTAEDCLGFIRTLLCEDSSLEVAYSSNKPFRWALSYPTDVGVQREEVGLFFYNYFGSRSKRVFQNKLLPSRYGENAV